MPEIVYYVACSLDGFIATPDGSTDWLTPFEKTGEDYGFSELYESVDCLLMGSRTYEAGLTKGPWRAADKPSWVFTRRQLELAHPSITLTSEEPTSLVADLDARGLKRAWFMGGGELASSFRAAGLISHYMIGMLPILLGDGIPLFGKPSQPEALKLASSTIHPSGVVQLSYERSTSS